MHEEFFTPESPAEATAQEKPAAESHLQEVLRDTSRDPHELLAQLAAESQQEAAAPETQPDSSETAEA